MKLTPKHSRWLALGAVIVCHTFFWVTLNHLHYSDPDTFTYQALARETSLHGPLTTLPQVEDLGWGKKFADKNLAFNLVNGLFYKVGGERGVELSLFAMSLGVMVALFFAVEYFLPPGWAALVTALTYLNATFAIRLFLMRPHVWAMGCFLGVLLAIFRRAPVAALAFGALFGWGYPVYYLPLALLALAYAFYGYRRNDPERAEMKKVCQWGAAGVLVSMVVHPAFPSNLDWVKAISQIAVNNMALSTVELPIENVPQRSDFFVQRFALFLLVLVGGLAYEAYFRRPFKPESRRTDYFFLWFLNAGLWAAAFFQPRAAEYAIPCTTILMGLVVWRLFDEVKPRVLAGAVVAVALIANYTSLTDFYAKGAKFSLNPKVPMMVIGALPKGAAGKKVFNCEWEAGAFLLYRRPDVKFVDILDPTFLPKAKPLLATQRNLLFEGKLLPYSVIHQQFGADYVVCRHAALVERLDRDPFFTRLFPPVSERVPQEVAGFSGVYEVNTARTERFVHEIHTVLTPGPGRGLSSATNLTPAAQNTPFWNFVPVAERAQASGDPLCFDAVPAATEIKRFAGSEWLGLGGGPSIEVKWNGKALIRSRDNDGDVDYLRDWVKLPRPVQPTDKVEFRVCSRQRDVYHGAAFSFWTGAERTALCAEKGFARPRSTPGDWPLTLDTPPDCFGRVATAATK